MELPTCLCGVALPENRCVVIGWMALWCVLLYLQSYNYILTYLMTGPCLGIICSPSPLQSV